MLLDLHWPPLCMCKILSELDFATTYRPFREVTSRGHIDVRCNVTDKTETHVEM